VLGETGVLNNALRFEDEFVRHKILDVIGDLSLVGIPVDRPSGRATRRPRAAHRLRRAHPRRDRCVAAGRSAGGGVRSGRRGRTGAGIGAPGQLERLSAFNAV
jgi:hypothetical protein